LCSNATNLNASRKSSNGSGSPNLHGNQLGHIQKSICDNAVFLHALADLLPTLQRIISSDNDPTSDKDKSELRGIMREVQQSNVEIYRMVLKMQSSIPAPVEDQKPVYFLDACDCPARIDLTWINSWEAFFAVLSVRFRQRGLKIVEKKRFILQDAHSDRLININCPFSGCFIPGRKISMDACFDENEHVRSCCPSCRYQEPGIPADRPIDWNVISLSCLLIKR